MVSGNVAPASITLPGSASGFATIIAAAGAGGTQMVPPLHGTFDVAQSFAALTDGATVTWAIASVLVDNRSLTFTTHGGSRTLNTVNEPLKRRILRLVAR